MESAPHEYNNRLSLPFTFGAHLLDLLVLVHALLCGVTCEYAPNYQTTSSHYSQIPPIRIHYKWSRVSFNGQQYIHLAEFTVEYISTFFLLPSFK